MTHSMLFVGGCHVAGYLITPARAFPIILSRQLGSNLVGQMPHVTFTQLPAHLVTIAALAPTQVVFQLGNYECSASSRLLFQCLLPAAAAKWNKSVGTAPVGAAPVGAAPVGAAPVGAAQYLRVAGAGLLNAAL